MTDELISSPQLLKLYQSQLIMLLTSAQARALHFRPLPRRRHKRTPYTHRDNFFPLSIPPARGCHQWLLFQHAGAAHLSFTPFATLCSGRDVVAPPASHEGAGWSLQAKVTSRQHSGGNSGRNWSGFRQAQVLCWKDAEAESHLNPDTRGCGPVLCPCRWVCFTSVPQFHQLLLCDIVCPAPPEG